MVHHIKHGRLHPRSDSRRPGDSTAPDDDKLGLIAGGWYAASLKPFRSPFGDQLLVLLHDDIRQDPRGVYKTALSHVGATPDFVPAHLEEFVDSNQEGDSSEWRREVSSADRHELYRYFEDDLRELEQMTGHDFSMWDCVTPPE